MIWAWPAPSLNAVSSNGRRQYRKKSPPPSILSNGYCDIVWALHSGGQDVRYLSRSQQRLYCNLDIWLIVFGFPTRTNCFHTNDKVGIRQSGSVKMFIIYFFISFFFSSLYYSVTVIGWHKVSLIGPLSRSDIRSRFLTKYREEETLEELFLSLSLDSLTLFN